MANVPPRIINQHNFIYRTVFSTRFDKQDEDDQVLDEIEIWIILNFNRNLTESDIDEIDVRPQLEQQIWNQESKDSGWRFEKKFNDSIFL